MRREREGDGEGEERERERDMERERRGRGRGRGRGEGEGEGKGKGGREKGVKTDDIIFTLMHTRTQTQLNLHHTTFAIVNGSLTIVTFFICRIANTPLVIIYYAYQYHDGHLFSALQAMQPICFIVIILEMSMEIYWFLAIIRIGLQTLNSRATSGAVKKRSD